MSIGGGFWDTSQTSSSLHTAVFHSEVRNRRHVDEKTSFNHTYQKRKEQRDGRAFRKKVAAQQLLATFN